MNKKQDVLEWRRMRAWELAKEGWTPRAIAEAFGVSRSIVCRWLRRATMGGKDALKQRVATGRPRQLTTEQRQQLPELLKQGAQAFGFRGDVWTAERVAILIKREYGVKYHPSHVGRLLREIGWTVQRPVTRATQRDEEAIDKWKTERWPELKKSRN
jgi:transposase